MADNTSQVNINPIENIRDLIETTDNPINTFYNQYIFLKGNTENLAKISIFKKNRYTFVSPIHNNNYFTRIISEYMTHKRKIAVYFEDNYIREQFIATLLTLISPTSELKVYQTNKFLKDIESYPEMYEIIKSAHNNSQHGNEVIVFEKLSNEYYKPNLKSLIRKAINNCNCYQDNSENAKNIVGNVSSKCHETYELEIWEYNKKKYLCSIDQGSLFAQIYNIKGSSWTELRNALLRIFNDMGKPKSMVFKAFDNKMLSVQLLEWLQANEINTVKTNKSECLEKFYNSISQRFNSLKNNGFEEEFDLVTAALYNYNTAYKTSIKNVPQFVHLNNFAMKTIGIM